MDRAPSAYGWLMLAGIAASLACWVRLGKKDSRLVLIYLGGLFGAMFGAKIVFLLAEGWLYFHAPNRWVILATGKSVLGALLGGYVGVEMAKRAVGYGAATGDLFALVVPLGLLFGRIGCILNGCCLGREIPASWFSVRDAGGHVRWPAAHVELLFNLIAFITLAVLRKLGLARNQLFHVYLVGYGTFRLLHERWRDTPRIAGGWTGYQFAAIAVIVLGACAYARRAGSSHAATPSV